MNRFKEHLRRSVALDDNELRLVSEKVKILSIRKGDYFQMNGQISNRVAFIEKGLIKSFYIIDGNERIGRFLNEGDWIGDYYSFITEDTSNMLIQAIEDTKLIELNKLNMHWLYDNLPKMERYGRLQAEQIYVQTHLRSNYLQNESAELKYKRFLRENPSLIDRVQSYEIASYLGISPETLSRVRKKINSAY